MRRQARTLSLVSFLFQDFFFYFPSTKDSSNLFFLSLSLLASEVLGAAVLSFSLVDPHRISRGRPGSLEQTVLCGPVHS